MDKYLLLCIVVCLAAAIWMYVLFSDDEEDEESCSIRFQNLKNDLKEINSWRIYNEKALRAKKLKVRLKSTK